MKDKPSTFFLKIVLMIYFDTAPSSYSGFIGFIPRQMREKKRERERVTVGSKKRGGERERENSWTKQGENEIKSRYRMRKKKESTSQWEKRGERILMKPSAGLISLGGSNFVFLSPFCVYYGFLLPCWMSLVNKWKFSVLCKFIFCSFAVDLQQINKTRIVY